MKRILSVLLILAPSVAMAHPGHGFGLEAGILHPLTGADHLLAMVGVGLWASVQGGRARFALPSAFLAAMAVGALAVPGLGALTAAVEPIILASVILLGTAVALALRMRLLVALPLVALMGLAHGAAHGMEGTGAAFGLGMLAATAVLHGAGLVLGLTRNRSALRISGALALLAGLTLAFAG